MQKRTNGNPSGPLFNKPRPAEIKPLAVIKLFLRVIKI